MVEGEAGSLPDHVHLWKVGPPTSLRSDAQCAGCGNERSFPSTYGELRRATIEKAGVAQRRMFNAGANLQMSLEKRFAAADALDGDYWREDTSRETFGTGRYTPIDDSYE